MYLTLNTEKGVNLKVVLGLLGATGALGLAGYYYQQDPSSQKAIEEHNAAVASSFLILNLPTKR